MIRRLRSSFAFYAPLMLGVEPRSKKPSDKGRLNDLEKGFDYIREEPPLKTLY